MSFQSGGMFNLTQFGHLYYEFCKINGKLRKILSCWKTFIEIHLLWGIAFHFLSDSHVQFMSQLNISEPQLAGFLISPGAKKYSVKREKMFTELLCQISHWILPIICIDFR